jgi:hypothetical protein
VPVTPDPSRRAAPRPLRARIAPRAAAATLVGLLLLALAGPAAVPTLAASGDAPVMDAAVLLQGHARVGAWMAIRVQVRNDGPSVVGELRLSGGAQGRTRFGTVVDLPTDSNKSFLLYAQPPAFGGTLDVSLVAGGRTISTREVAFTVHDSTQLVVGIVADQPQRLVPQIDLLPSPNGTRAAIFPLAIDDLPERVEAWSPVDRLIWQDVDSSALSAAQLTALRGWVAGGGRLIVAGGTVGGAAMSGFPDDLLPYRPTTTLDVAPSGLAGLLGEVPADATDVPALAGPLGRGRALATVGDQAIAADAPYGAGSVTVLGFDPGAGWIADLEAGVEGLWRRFLPTRQAGPVVAGDDNQLVNAVTQLPALSLPPTGGLLALLAGYILMIGPINYLVLRKLDRREWAWVTMPLLIAVFAAGAYGFGAVLRGLDVIVNEVAIVRGAPNATEGTAQVYLGVFSPSRGTYQLEVPGGALLSSTLTGEFAGGAGGALDILQGDPARIRDLVVGFGSLRTLRAETAATVPLVRSDLRLDRGRLRGTITNASDVALEKPAVVLGSSVVVLRDLAPGATADVDLVIRKEVFGETLSNKILGTVFLNDPSRTTDANRQSIVRHAVIDQLTYDPVNGAQGQLQAEGPVMFAWGSSRILDVVVSGQEPRRTGNALYYLPLPMTVRGPVAFEGDLLRSSLVESDAGFFNKDPSQISMARGTATIAYRPIAFDGALDATRVVVSMGFGDQTIPQPTTTLEPLAEQPCRGEETDLPDCVEVEPPEPCDPNVEQCFGGGELPILELFDRSGDGRWIRMADLDPGKAYDLVEPERYVDPASGTLLVRFVNERVDGLGFQFQARIEGEIE